MKNCEKKGGTKGVYGDACRVYGGCLYWDEYAAEVNELIGASAKYILFASKCVGESGCAKREEIVKILEERATKANAIED